MSRGVYRSIKCNSHTLIKNYEQVDISSKLDRLIIDFLAAKKRVLVLSSNSLRFSYLLSENLVYKREPHVLHLINGGVFYYGSFAQTKSLRGIGLDLIVLEGMQDQPDLFFKVVVPLIQFSKVKLVAVATEVSQFFEGLFAQENCFHKLVLHKKEEKREVLLRLTERNYKKIKRNNQSF